jgi:hypothetical protein
LMPPRLGASTWLPGANSPQVIQYAPSRIDLVRNIVMDESHNAREKEGE